MSRSLTVHLLEGIWELEIKQLWTYVCRFLCGCAFSFLRDVWYYVVCQLHTSFYKKRTVLSRVAIPFYISRQCVSGPGSPHPRQHLVLSLSSLLPHQWSVIPAPFGEIIFFHCICFCTSVKNHLHVFMYVYFWIVCSCSIDLRICVYYCTVLISVAMIVSINIGSWYF